jgi:plasmid stabilization system protein ParE
VEVTYHPLVKRDVIEALRYYTQISQRLAEEFQAELQVLIARAASNPLRFHLTERGFRRANLRRFPYHVLYEVREEALRIIHVRHNKRHPDYGKERV